MTMPPPKCRVCGTAEWNHLCSGEPPSHGTPRVEARPVTYERRPMRVTDRVTPVVTPVTNTVTQCPSCVKLQTRISELEKKLAELTKPPLSQAERAKAYRARQRAAKPE